MFTADPGLAVFTPDLDAAAVCYGETMGLPCVSRTEDMLHFESGPLCLYVTRSAQAQGFTPSFTLEDAQVARANLLAAGCEALGDGHFRDPFGFVFGVMERS